MADIKIAHLQGVVQVDLYAPISLPPNPHVVAIIGSEFLDADTVLVNGMSIPFDIIHDGLILITIPEKLADGKTRNPLYNANIVEVTVSTNKLPNLVVPPDRSKVALQIGSSVKKVEGLQRLVQTFVKLLFTTRGSDVFHPNLGGDALMLLGNMESNDPKHLTREFTIAVTNTADQLSNEQSKREVPASERLLSASVVSSMFDPTTSALIASVSLVSFDKEEAVANITI